MNNISYEEAYNNAIKDVIRLIDYRNKNSSSIDIDFLESIEELLLKEK